GPAIRRSRRRRDNRGIDAPPSGGLVGRQRGWQPVAPRPPSGREQRGSPMATKSAVCPECGTPAAPGRYACTECGALLAAVGTLPRTWETTPADEGPVATDVVRSGAPVAANGTNGTPKRTRRGRPT